MSDAETLRNAAKLLRERAEMATPGPWRQMCLGSEGCLVLRATGTPRERGRGRVARFGQKDWKADHADAEYVAAMHPGVALAVADWLDAEAAFAEHEVADLALEALAVARAILGAEDGAQS